VFEGTQNEAPRLFRKIGLDTKLALIDHAWEAELGSLSTVAQIVALDNAALIVEVSSSVAMQEINMRRQELLRRINRYFPDRFLKQITVRMAQHG
jgi:hypothetical protein